MTEVRVDNITDAAGTGKPDFEDGITYAGAALSTLNTHEYSTTEPASPKNGSIWYDSGTIKIYVNGGWYTVNLNASAAAGIAWGGDRSLAVGGKTGSAGTEINTIEYFSISALSGTASDFGDLTRVAERIMACSDSTYGVFLGGQDYSGGTTYYRNVIDYVTIATTGNASDFGDLTVGRSGGAAVSDGTYGCAFGGSTGLYVNTIDYVTVASPGNATDFGDLTESPYVCAGGNDATRGLRFGGYTTVATNVIDYFTIASPGNAIDFGDLTAGDYYISGLSDETYAVVGCGGLSRSTIEYVTVQTTGNATDFGDASDNSYARGASSDGTYGVWAGGESGVTITGSEYITIATPGNASDFGDLLTARFDLAGTSGAAS